MKLKMAAIAAPKYIGEEIMNKIHHKHYTLCLGTNGGLVGFVNVLVRICLNKKLLTLNLTVPPQAEIKRCNHISCTSLAHCLSTHCGF
jgi:hypothetical protein